MGYQYNASDSSNLIKEGDYEVIIEKMEVRTTSNGKNKLYVQYRIRTDVEQLYANKCVFEDIWEEKENPGVFNRKRINKILGTQNVKDGQEFEDINAIIDFLEGAQLIVHVIIDFNDYRGEDINAINYYKKSKAQPQTIGGVPVDEFKKNPPSNDDLPF